MWIEIIGLPGVGKTTLIEENISFIRNKFDIIESRKSNLYQKIITKLIYYFYFYWIISDKILAKKISYRMGFRFFKSPQKNIFFYDSGIIQVLLESLIEKNFKNQPEILRIIDTLHAGTHHIYIKDNMADIAHRETHRDKPRFQLGLDETLARYAQAENFIEKELLHRLTIIDTITPHNYLDFEKALKQ